MIWVARPGRAHTITLTGLTEPQAIALVRDLAARGNLEAVVGVLMVLNERLTPGPIPSRRIFRFSILFSARTATSTRPGNSRLRSLARMGCRHTRAKTRPATMRPMPRTLNRAYMVRGRSWLDPRAACGYTIVTIGVSFRQLSVKANVAQW